MDKDTSILVENAHKKYCKSLKTGMVYGVHNIARNVLGLSARPSKLRKQEFWAVKGASFELKKGDAIGLIGRNGAGKTTMLQLINGIFWPDIGSIHVRGRIGALIAVGAGFHPQLTGRENISANAAILGMTRKELKSKFDEIVDFADIGDFLDTPVKHYSSGMFVRLGFAIAVHCETDILLVDEILAVGDTAFRRKCFEKLERARSQGITIVLVTHSMLQVERLCNKAAYFRQGEIVVQGEPKDVIRDYLEDINAQELASQAVVDNRAIPQIISDPRVELYNPRLVDAGGNVTNKFDWNSDVTIEVDYVCKDPVKDCLIIFHIYTAEGLEMCNTTSQNHSEAIDLKNRGTIRCRFKNVPLANSTFSFDMKIHQGAGKNLAYAQKIAGFQTITPRSRLVTANEGLVMLDSEWEVAASE